MKNIADNKFPTHQATDPRTGERANKISRYLINNQDFDNNELIGFADLLGM